MKVLEFFFSKVAGYNLIKKELHQVSFMWNLSNFSKQFFTVATFERSSEIFGEVFLGKFPWWRLVFINSQGSITGAGLQHRHFFWKIFFFFRKPSLQRSCNCLLLTIILFLVFERTPLLYSLSEPATNRNSEEQLSGIYLRKKCVGKVPF